MGWCWNSELGKQQLNTDCKAKENTDHRSHDQKAMKKAKQKEHTNSKKEGNFGALHRRTGDGRKL